MRGADIEQGALFSVVSLEARVPADHPLRKIRPLLDETLKSLDGTFKAIYAESGRPSIPPERLLRASLLQVLYSVRSERQLMEQLDYNLRVQLLREPARQPAAELGSCGRRPQCRPSYTKNAPRSGDTCRDFSLGATSSNRSAGDDQERSVKHAPLAVFFITPHPALRVCARFHCRVFEQHRLSIAGESDPFRGRIYPGASRGFAVGTHGGRNGGLIPRRHLCLLDGTAVGS